MLFAARLADATAAVAASVADGRVASMLEHAQRCASRGKTHLVARQPPPPPRRPRLPHLFAPSLSLCPSRCAAAAAAVPDGSGTEHHAVLALAMRSALSERLVAASVSAPAARRGASGT